jgi:hypothetical protein
MARDISDRTFKRLLSERGFRSAHFGYFVHEEFPSVMFGGVCHADGRVHRRETLRVLCAGLKCRRLQREEAAKREGE